MTKGQFRTLLAFSWVIAKGIERQSDGRYEFTGSSNDLDQWIEMLNERQDEMDEKDYSLTEAEKRELL